MQLPIVAEYTFHSLKKLQLTAKVVWAMSLGIEYFRFSWSEELLIRSSFYVGRVEVADCRGQSQQSEGGRDTRTQENPYLFPDNGSLILHPIKPGYFWTFDHLGAFSWTPGGSDLLKKGLKIKFSQNMTQFILYICYCIVYIYSRLRKVFFPRFKTMGADLPPPRCNQVKTYRACLNVYKWGHHSREGG